MKEDKNKEVRVMSAQDYFSKYPELKPKEVEVNRSNINQEEFMVFERYFSNVCYDYTVYKQLYTNQEKIDVMNHFNSLILSRMQIALYEKVGLSLARMLDREEMCGKDNLSLKRYVVLGESKGLEEKYQELLDLYSNSKMKKWRNRSIAHNDLKTMMKDEGVSYRPGFEVFGEMLEIIGEMISDIKGDHFSIDIDVVIPFDLNGDSFIAKMRRSNEGKIKDDW